MEVHHHPHVEKKSFKEYLLEGLMIFVAVSMGFFAENLRENISNNETVKKNMETIVANLKSDTASLHSIIELNNSRIKNLDNIDKFRYTNLTDTTVLKDFLLHVNPALTFDFFRINKVALDQMKSSDGFRLVKQQNIIDSIFAYYEFNGVLDENFDYQNHFQRQVFNLYHRLFEPDNLVETSRIVKEHREWVVEFFNTIATLNIGLQKFYTPHLVKQLENATRLIYLIERTYILNK